MNSINIFKFIKVLRSGLFLISLCLSCGKAKNQGSKTQALSGPYSGDINGSTILDISPVAVVAAKTQKSTGIQSDPGKGKYLTGGLYAFVTLHCIPCHAGVNKEPFASPAGDLAYASVKRYLTFPAENSKIISQIRSGHNGSKPEWESEVAPLIENLAK